MSIVTPIIRFVLLGGATALAAPYVIGVLPMNQTPPNTEDGFVNPEYVELQTPTNDFGNLELYLDYDDGQLQIRLPITSGEFGPTVGDADYHWSSMSPATKSRLVENSWQDLQVETRKSILTNELEQMLEKYEVSQNE